MSKQSLRDIIRKKTEQALAGAAFELAFERGLDGFVINDVAQRAKYSARTFANYFSCKEEAVAMAVLAFNGTWEVRKLPDSTNPMDTLQGWIMIHLTPDLLWKIRELLSLSKQYSALEPYILSVIHRLQSSAVESLDSLYYGIYSKGYSHLLVGAVFGAIHPILNGDIKVLLPGDPDEDTSGATTFRQYLEKTFGYLRKGC